jgi:hypothetical protein
MMPGCASLEARVEFSGLARSLFPRWIYVTFMILFIITLMAANVSSVIVSAQVMDNAILKVWRTKFKLTAVATVAHFRAVATHHDAGLWNNLRARLLPWSQHDPEVRVRLHPLPERDTDGLAVWKRVSGGSIYRCGSDQEETTRATCLSKRCSSACHRPSPYFFPPQLRAEYWLPRRRCPRDTPRDYQPGRERRIPGALCH